MSIYMGDVPVAVIQDISGKQDKATALNYNNISNCITNIPQDIKLELNNGTLTLKAGSKVYVPNGAGVFNTVTIQNDISTTYSNSGVLIYSVKQDGTLLVSSTPNKTVSGTTDAASTQTYHTWYDTTNNLIKRFSTDLTTPVYNCSFPLCIVTVSGGKITSIDQVFNGFGYIGSTVFALPGVKGLIPNGRNSDGSLNNTNASNTVVRTASIPSNVTSAIFMSSSGVIGCYSSYNYNNEENYNYVNDAKYARLNAGVVKSIGGEVTSFAPKTTFHALDYNDKETIVGWGDPDWETAVSLSTTRYSTYTCPTNGFLFLSNYNGVTSLTTSMNNNILYIQYGNSSYTSSTMYRVVKGEVLTVDNNTGTGKLYFLKPKGL